MAYPAAVIEPRGQFFGQPISLTEEAPSIKVLARMAAAKIQTHDDTVTNIILAPGPTLAEVFPVLSTIHVEAIVTASNGADKAGSWHIEGTFQTPASGGIVLLHYITTVHEYETDVGMTMAITPVPNSPSGLVAVQVTGLAATDFDWTAMLRYVVSTTISD